MRIHSTSSRRSRPRRPLRARSLTALALTLALAAALCAACGESNKTDTEAVAEGAAASPSGGAQVKPKDPIPEFVAQYAKDAHLHVQAVAFEDKVHAEVTRLAKRKVAARKDPYTYRSIIRRFYTRPDAPFKDRLVFTRGSGLSPIGQRMMTWYTELELHGVPAKDLHLPRIAKNEEMAADLVKKHGPLLEPLALTEADRDAITKLIRDRKLDVLGDPTALDTLTRALTAVDSPVKAMHAAVAKVRAPTDDEVERFAKIELYMADAFAIAAWRMKYKNRYNYDQDLFKKKDRKQREAIMSDFMRDELPPLLAKGTRDVLDWTDAVIPKHEQYHKLLPHLKRYKAIVDAGGWEDTPVVPGLRKGMKHEVVPKLKRRLAIEGYLKVDGDPREAKFDERFDQALFDAITSYQETHQLKVTGEPHKVFWRSIDVPAKKRMEYLAITVDRWREAAPRAPYHVFVNIPDFHAEVWKDGERVFRMKLVVGNRQFGCNLSTKRWERLNATPRQVAEISHIVVNPYWNIPERILREEVLPAAAKDPNYWEENGYECVRRNGDECTKARQSTGDENALGRVKIIFPNKYNTYMHDTPKKHFFNFPVRALSHGCMRMHKPLEMAQLLLKLDGQFDENDWNARFEEKKESVIVLEKKVPIYIEYYTNRVDSKDRVHWLADIYKYDRYRHRGRPFDARRCRPDELEHARNPGDDGMD